MFQIDHTSHRTIYNQVIDNIKRLVNTGTLKPGEMIPTIAELSKNLIINPNTTQKAYMALVSQGILHTEGMKDWYVSAGEGITQSPQGAAGLYARIRADVQELMTQGEDMSSIARLLGMEESSYIEIINFTKTFDNIKALDSLTMNVKKGSIYGLSGVNGSGKTTALKSIAGLYNPDSGQIRIGGESLQDKSQQSVVGYMPESMYFMPDYNMKMLCKFYRNRYGKRWNDDRYQALLALFKLNDDQLLSTFSQGMKKKAGFTFSICTMPDVLLLDETLDGMDPLIRKHVFKEIIEDVAERQMTVLMVSHNLRELDSICDTIGIIKQGRLVTQQDLDDVKANTHKIMVSFESTAKYPYDGLDVVHMEETGQADIVVVRGKEESTAAHLQQFNPTAYELLPLTLDEIFIYESEDEPDESIE